MEEVERHEQDLRSGIAETKKVRLTADSPDLEAVYELLLRLLRCSPFEGLRLRFDIHFNSPNSHPFGRFMRGTSGTKRPPGGPLSETCVVVPFKSSLWTLRYTVEQKR